MLGDARARIRRVRNRVNADVRLLTLAAGSSSEGIEARRSWQHKYNRIPDYASRNHRIQRMTEQEDGRHFMPPRKSQQGDGRQEECQAVFGETVVMPNCSRSISSYSF